MSALAIVETRETLARAGACMDGAGKAPSTSLAALEQARTALTQLYEAGGGANKDTALSYLRTHYARYVHDLNTIAQRTGPKSTVLDLGAAPFLVPYALSLLGHTVVAVDFRPSDWLTVALPFQVQQANCDGVALPFEDNVFDVVVFTEVFEHLHVNLNFTMKEIRRVLKPGGFLYLTTPNLLGLRGTIRLLKNGAMRDNLYDCWKGAETGGFLGHVREYTPREIRDYLQACGFSNVQVDTVNVYKKAMAETLFWSLVSAPFKYGKENIRAIAEK